MPHGGDYFRAMRMQFIKDSIQVYGYINRIHLMRMFWVSDKIAHSDLAIFKKANPKLMVYSKQLKCYVHSGIRKSDDPPPPQTLVLMRRQRQKMDGA
jgi:hypothetical protein